MAIIRLDCNLNGGDSVTPNNELFYRIYGDVDAYAAPIHTTGTALSDANVTVDNDTVIITGVYGATNTTFKIAAVDGAFNEGVLSDASVESSILFEDDFAGAVVDVAKWNVINLNGGIEDKILLSQNDEFLFYCNNTGTLTVIGDDALISVNGFDMLSGIRVFTFDINSNSQNDSTWYFGIADSTEPLVSATNRITIGRTATAGNIKLITMIGGVTTSEEPIFDLSTTTTVKIIIDGSAVTFSYWTGSAWSVWTTNTEFTTTNTWNIVGVYRTASGIGSDIGDQFTIDNVYVTDADFSTQYPS